MTGKSASALGKFMTALAKCYEEMDCSLLEINPLITTKDGRMLALDAKINFDDNAMYRHPARGVARSERRRKPPRSRPRSGTSATSRSRATSVDKDAVLAKVSWSIHPLPIGGYGNRILHIRNDRVRRGFCQIGLHEGGEIRLPDDDVGGDADFVVGILL